MPRPSPTPHLFTTTKMLEAASPDEVAAKVRRYGFALMRSLVSADFIATQITLARLTLAASRSKKTLIDLTLAYEAFGNMLGVKFNVEGGPLQLTSYAMEAGDWRQDHGYRASMWMPLTLCGKGQDSGIELVAQPIQARVPDLSAAYIQSQGWLVFKPAFQPGDALFFNGRSIYRIYKEPMVMEDHVVMKMTAMPKFPQDFNVND